MQRTTDGKIKIGFISKKNPTDKRAWSGTMYQLYKNIKSIDNVEVIWIAPKKTILLKLIFIPYRLLAKIFKKRRSRYLTIASKQFCQNLDSNLINQVDILFAAADTLYFAYLETNKPIIHLMDATFKQIYNCYEDYSNFFDFDAKQCEFVNNKGYNKACRLIVSSNWVEQSLVTDYRINKDKIKVIEFGSNIDDIDLDKFSRKSYNQNSECLNILFLGVDWNRKGGDIAVDCVQYLNDRGINTILNVVGVEVPEKYKNNPTIKQIGFLDKNIETEYSLLKSIIQNSDLLLLPSRAECSAIVFCEASAYGLPVFTTDTGGIPNYVINGKNGYRLSLSSTGSDFAKKIIEVVENDELLNLAIGARQMYNEKLNWTIWRNKFSQILSEI